MEEDGRDRGGMEPLPDLTRVFYTDAEIWRQSFDVYLPDEPGEMRPAVLFVHGGGFKTGSSSAFRFEGNLVNERGWVGFSTNYRLDVTPGHPAAMDDVLSAIAYIREHADEYGVDPGRIAAWGTSAGGSLVALAATVPTGPLDEGSRVLASVAFSGPMNLETIHDASRHIATIEGYLGCVPEECPELYDDASATTHVTADDSPMFISHAQDEGMPVEVAIDLAERFEAAGVPVVLDIVPGNLHARNLSIQTEGLMDRAFAFLEDQFAAAEGASTDTTTTTAPDVDPPVGDAGDGETAGDETAGDDTADDEDAADDDEVAALDEVGDGEDGGGGGLALALLIGGLAAAAAAVGVLMSARRRVA